MWERACSRMRCFSHLMYWLTHCIREQARSHICFAMCLRDLHTLGQQHVHQANQWQPDQAGRIRPFGTLEQAHP